VIDLFDVLFALGMATLFSIPLAVSGWALLDAARRPQWAWALAGRNQAMWMGAILIGTFTVIGGLCICAWYLARVRPVIAAAEDGDLG
jgi:hypothetical protein